ncbi:hypothetical protein MKX03_000676 [Papaver bracteatum]|nr:hypothetical protein MKX03_000676 [Papaver bracteatum]
MTKRISLVEEYMQFGTRYGASLCKQIKKMEISQHSKYFCEFPRKYALKRKAVGIWGCKYCSKVQLVDSWITASAVTVKSTIRRWSRQEIRAHQSFLV